MKKSRKIKESRFAGSFRNLNFLKPFVSTNFDAKPVPNRFIQK